MACPITIKENINKVIDDKIASSNVDPFTLKSQINKIWNTNVVFEVNSPELPKGVMKDEVEITKLVEKVYNSQSKLERNLSSMEGKVDTAVPVIDDNFALLLYKYQANAIGVIPAEKVKRNTYDNLQKDLNNLYGDTYTARINKEGDIYVSLEADNKNIFKEQVEKNVSHNLSTSILKNAGVKSSSIQLIKKIADRFETNIRIISEKQLRFFPGVRPGAKGFYDSDSKIAYLVLERIKDETTLHEAFSHPFVNYIKENYNPLYNTLLAKAMSNQEILAYLAVNYPNYSDVALEMEAIIKGLDMEFTKELKDPSLLKSIDRFWQRVIAYIKEALGITSDISKYSTFKEVAKLALNSNEKINLTNFQLKGLGIMESYEEDEAEENVEIPDEILEKISELRKQHMTQKTLIEKQVEDLKNGIQGREVLLSNGEVKLLDTFTARIQTLSSSLNKTSDTKTVIANDEYLAASLTLLRNVTRKTGDKINLEEVNKILNNMGMVSQIIEETLVVSSLLKERIINAEKSSAPLIQKQKEISQYSRVLEAVKEAIKPLEQFFLEATTPELTKDNPVINIIQDINRNIAYADKINGIVVVDSVAQQIFELFSPVINENIDKAIKSREEKLKRKLAWLAKATSDKDKKSLQRDISDIINEIRIFESKKPTLENIKKTIKGEFGDSSYIKYLFDAAFNSENVVVAGFARIIDKVYMQALDKTQITVNQLQSLLDRYMDAAGKTKSDQMNLTKFYDQLYQKVEYKKVKTASRIVEELDPITNKVTQEQVFEEVLEDVTEDQILGEFDYYKLEAELARLLYDVRQAKRTGTEAEIQKAIELHRQFKKKYFETSLTEEYEKRTQDSNLIIEADLKGLKDSQGNPLSLDTNPELIFAAREKIQTLYDKKNQFYKIFETDRHPTDAELNDMEKINQEIRSLSSIHVHGTAKLKTGIDLAISRAITRSQNSQRGVYSFNVRTHALARYEVRRREVERVIEAQGLTGTDEGKAIMRAWHKVHSKIIKSNEYYNLRNRLTRELDTAYEGLLDSVPFLNNFVSKDKKADKKRSLDALWQELISKTRSLKDLENTVNGTIAQEDLQKDILSLMESIERAQRQVDSILELTNKNDLVEFDRLVRGLKVTRPNFTRSGSVSSININVKNFEQKSEGQKQAGSLIDMAFFVEFNAKDAKKLQKILKAVDASALRELEKGDQEASTPQEINAKLEKIRMYIFLNSTYAKTLAVKLKTEISGRHSKDKVTDEIIASNNRELKELLNDEMHGIIRTGKTIQEDYELSPREEELIETISKYNTVVNEKFKELAALTERVTTSYYDETSKAVQENTFSEQLKTLLVIDDAKAAMVPASINGAPKNESNPILELFRETNNYYNVSTDQSTRETIDENYKDMVDTGSYKLYPKVAALVNKLYKASDWYKNNHYDKLEIKNGVAYRTPTPTPLWTTSVPTDDRYLEITPNNSYAKRSINEFLLDENGQPTNIRLKRTDIKDRIFGHMTPKRVLDDGTPSEYLNERYKEISKKNPKLKSVIDDINDLHYELQGVSGVKGLGVNQGLIRVAAQGWELFDEGGREFLRKKAELIKDKFRPTDRDVDLGIGVGDFSGRLLESVPVKFLANIPYELRSRDIFGLMAMFASQAYLISGLNELYPTAKEFHKRLEENSPAVTRNSRIIHQKINEELNKPLAGLENTTADNILHLIQTMILNKRRKDLSLGSFSLTKTLDSFSSLTAFSTMAGFIRPNLILNTLVGKVQIWLEAWSNGLINREDYNSGVVALYKYFGSDFMSDFYKLGHKSVMGQLLIRYNTQSKDLFELFGQEIRNNKIKDVASLDLFFKTRRLSEFELSNSVTLALLAKYKVLSEGKQISLLDAYVTDKDGNIKLKEGITKLDGSEFTQEDEYRIRVKATSANLIIQGNYSKHFITKFDTTLLGPQISLYRKHLMSYRNKTWGPVQVHYGIEDVITPYNRQVFLAIFQVVRNLGNKQALNSAIEELKLSRKEGNTYKKAYIHNGIILLSWLLISLIGDDEDESSNTGSFDSFVAKSVLYQLMRIKSDLELFSAFPFVQGLDEALGIYKNPSIAISKTGLQFWKTIKDIGDYSAYKLGLGDLEEKDVTIQKDYYEYDKGTLKIIKDFGQLTGLTGSTINPEQMVENFKNMSSSLYR